MLLVKKDNLYWTDHVKRKMRQYRLTESRVKRVLRYPKRLEVGVAEDTVAGMQPAGSVKHPYEIWVMWSLAKARDKSPGSDKNKESPKLNLNRKTTIISAWRYPGKSPIGEPPPIPEEVWAIIRKGVKA